MNAELLVSRLQERFADALIKVATHVGEVTIDVKRENYLDVCKALRDEPAFQFEQLMDLCGVDYLDYGMGEWTTDDASGSGFERGVERTREDRPERQGPRFAVVSHLLSVSLNQRIRVRVWCDDAFPLVPTVTPIWASANWFEREAFDLYGILFEGHPDLRRILTDYGFVGHPFRKDFPLIGNVELRYDATEKRCVYEPVSIEPRVLVPRVIRDDGRYADLNKN
ncbi:MAG TPA: NADH-quinone oxidoreductase subunit C [Hyphomicrobiaceae bacterium]|nr:NADH-quinone oxidoreductase subunit C [Hyphomicrobiaceae bacterium]